MESMKEKLRDKPKFKYQCYRSFYNETMNEK